MIYLKQFLVLYCLVLPIVKL
ncbi:hypothetical protein [Pleurocapsa sp. PCC 7327]